MALHATSRVAARAAMLAAILVAVLAVASLAPTPLHAQPAPLAQPPSLLDLQRLAITTDPRAQQAALLRAQSRLRELSIRAERYPGLSLDLLAQYQSDVPTIPVNFPGVSVPTPPHQTYDSRLNATLPLFDPTVRAQIGVERAQLAQSEAELQTTLFTLRQSVNDAYFNALLLQSQRGEVVLSIRDLEAQLRVARDRVAAGAALPSEAAALEAQILRQEQSVAQLDVSRMAALAVLRDLTGVPFTLADTLRPVDLAASVRLARAEIDTLTRRPEYAQFARTREALSAQEQLIRARELPAFTAFGTFGYGRPGLNTLLRHFDSYWIVGVRGSWVPFTWGTPAREREVLTLQQRIVTSEEAAFRASLDRSVVLDIGNIDRLTVALAQDDRIVALREEVLRTARAQFLEGVITASDYVDRETDLTDARLARSRHRAELAQAEARLLTTLGLEVR